MRVVIAHQAVEPTAPLDERDVLEAVASVGAVMQGDGWTVQPLAVTLDLAAAAHALNAVRPDLVFNLVEGLPGVPAGGSLAPAAAGLLQAMALPYTGSSPAALALTTDKPATRRALRTCGVPVPPGPEDGATGPFIIKHAFEHASYGLGRHSVVARPPTPMPFDSYAESFLTGREFNVSLLGRDDEVEVLPLAELVYAAEWPAGMPRILDYDGKWDPVHPLYPLTQRRFGALPHRLDAKLRRIAAQCWRVLGLAGYARIDLRLDDDGLPHVLDVNANPSLCTDAGFAAAAEIGGIDYRALIRRIVAATLRPPAATLQRAIAAHAPGEPRWRRSLIVRDAEDIPALCRSTGAFRAQEIAVCAELVRDRLARGEVSDYRFVLAERPAQPLLGFACYGPTPCTEACWDLYWIAVRPAAQRTRIGRRLVEAVVGDVTASGGSRIYAETSGRSQYAATHAFYAAMGFALQAVVPDFYAPDDDKQIWVLATAPKIATKGSMTTLPTMA
jgi:D-alanine-D-alanine ligase